MSVGLMLGSSTIPTGCADIAQHEVAVPLWAQGTTHPRPFEVAGGWTVELEQAQLAFGPLYLCASTRAGESCETARAEWLDTAVVDVLNDTPKELGSLRGVSGPVRSFMYDLGVISLLTEEQPKPLAAAQALDGNSVRLRGTARGPDQALEFLAALPIQQNVDTERGVPTIRHSSSQSLSAELGRQPLRLSVLFDPRPWLTEVDFDSLVVANPDACTTGSTCRGTLLFRPNTQPYRALRNALESGPRPAFRWKSQP